MAALGKNKTVEEFLCALSRATEELAVITRLEATWKGGLVMLCQESGHLEPPWWVLCYKGPVYSPAGPEGLSPALSSCGVVSRGILYKAGWLLTADMFGFELWKKNKTPHWNVELGKDSRCLKWGKKQTVFVYQVL